MHINTVPGRRGLIAVRADGADLVTLVGRLSNAFEEFKVSNDARIRQVEAKGAADVVTVEKVDRINAEITRLTGEITAVQAAANRPAIAGEGDRESRAALETFNRSLRAHAQRLSRPLPADVNAEGFAAYRGAFVEAMRVDNRSLSAEVLNTLRVGSDPDGGYLCPPEVDTAIDRVVTQLTAMRSLATVRTIGAASYKKPVQTSGAGFGGWGGETTAPSETGTPGLAVLEFAPGNMWAEPRATNDLLEDASINIEAWLADEVGITFVEQEGSAFILGDGAQKPRGLLAYDTVANADYAWGKLGFLTSGGAAGFAAANPSDKLIDLQHALKRQYRGNAAWLMNDATLGTIRKFKDGQGNYLWAPSGLVNGAVGQLLGHPVVTDDFMPDVAASAFPVAFGDFRRGYVVVDRRGTVVVRDHLTAKPFVKFYTTRRVGGGVQNYEAIKLLKIAA
jgi:HK97 family phage major capsid protein